MTIGIVGKKAGMTRIFTEDGKSVPVTVIEATPNRVTQLRTKDNDGYQAIQVAYGERKRSRINKPTAGHLSKVGIETAAGFHEFRLDNYEGDAFETGSDITVAQFEAGQKVDVQGTSKGKGFAGAVKRHNFSMQRATHGNSLSHRALGSVGQCQTPGRIFKGKKMAGQMGNEKCTQQTLEVVKVDSDRNLLLIKGSVPGAQGGDVVVIPSVKSKKQG